jgi:hypothetical protein
MDITKSLSDIKGEKLEIWHKEPLERKVKWAAGFV